MNDTTLDPEKQSDKSDEVLAVSPAASAGDGNVHRKLKARHLQMIAIGGTIGTGLFVGAGGALAKGGPLGILLGYSIMGMAVFTMMIALGEMCALYPVAGAFTHYASRFVDPALGFAMGYNYWYCYAITLPTEITAAALVLQYWNGARDINIAVWISIFIVAICSFNFCGVRVYGEAEFWFAIIKVVTILGLILLGVIITAGGTNAPAIGFRYWNNPGPFQQLNGIPGATGRFLAFWSVLVQAAFSYIGTEIVALTASEAENPRRNMPIAIRPVFYRILFFYVIGVFIMGLLVSPNDPGLLNNKGTAASPWVIACKEAGISVLPSIINAVVLTSAFSAGNSDLYAASRTLYGLACDGKAPAIFKKCTSNGLPIYALAVTAAMSLLAYMNVGESAASTFSKLSNISSITGLITWLVILISYIRFYHGCQRQQIDRSTFPYQAPFQPYASYAGSVLVSLIIFFNGFELFLRGKWSGSDFVVHYITLVIFAVFFVSWKLWKRSKFVTLDAMDFTTHRRELDEMSAAEELKEKKPTTLWGKVVAAVI